MYSVNASSQQLSGKSLPSKWRIRWGILTHISSLLGGEAGAIYASTRPAGAFLMRVLGNDTESNAHPGLSLSEYRIMEASTLSQRSISVLDTAQTAQQAA